MDAALVRLAAAKARAEEREQASLAALLRIEGGQNAVRNELAAMRECLQRIEKVLVGGAGDPVAHEPGAGEGADRRSPRLRRLLIAVVLGAVAAAALMGPPYWPWP